MDKTYATIQSFWIGKISPLEIISIKSFIEKGHKYHLYLYDDKDFNLPGVIIKDANEIIPQKFVFKDSIDIIGLKQIAKMDGLLTL